MKEKYLQNVLQRAGEIAARRGNRHARERRAQVSIPVRAPLALQVGVEEHAVRANR